MSFLQWRRYENKRTVFVSRWAALHTWSTLGNNNDFIFISCNGGGAAIPELLPVKPPTYTLQLQSINHRGWVCAVLAPPSHH